MKFALEIESNFSQTYISYLGSYGILTSIFQGVYLHPVSAEVLIQHSFLKTKVTCTEKRLITARTAGAKLAQNRDCTIRDCFKCVSQRFRFFTFWPDKLYLTTFSRSLFKSFFRAQDRLFIISFCAGS